MQENPIPALDSFLMLSCADGVLAFDGEERIIAWNPAMVRLTGLQVTEARGRSILEIFPFLYDKDYNRDIRAVLEGENLAVHQQPFHILETGRRGWFEATLSPLRDGHQNIIGAMALIRDVSDIYHAETVRGEQLQAISEALTRVVSEKEAAEIVVEMGFAAVDAGGGAIFRWDPERDALVPVAVQPCRGHEVAASDWEALPLSQLLPGTTAIREKRAVFLSTQEEALKLYPLLEGWLIHAGIHSVATVPLKTDNRVIGVLTMVYKTEQAFSESHKRFIFTLAGLCSQTMERARALAAEHQALLQAKEAAEQANEAKSSFIANMSHEIRTPLCALIGFAEFLAKPDLAPSRREALVEGVHRNGQVLVRLIDDILDLAKIEAGRLSIRQCDTEIERLLGEVADLHRDTAASKGLRLVVRLEHGTPRFIRTDPIRVRQILDNLLGNAVKFTESGEVRLTVSRPTVHAEQEATIAFEIEDTGTGLSPGEQNRLFQPFSQGDNTLTRRYRGSGLGLALSRRLAKTLGGDVVLAWSEAGRGSRFVVTLKVDIGVDESARRPERVESPPVKSDLTGVHVLVAEDAPDIQEMLRIILSEANASRVDIVGNGSEVIARANESLYDLILMDLQMPGMDGYSAARVLRRRGCRWPIVALSAHALPGDQEQARNAGFDAHLSKPVDVALLVETLVRLVRSRTCPEAIAISDSHPKSAPMS